MLLALRQTNAVSIGVHIPLDQTTAGTLSGVLRLQARLSIVELLISDVWGEGGTLAPLDPAAAVAALERAWLLANTLQLRLRLIGFERTRHVHTAVGDPAPACDDALLDTIRRGIPLAPPRAGIHARGAPDHASRLRQLAPSPENLRQLGLELAARGRPFIDLPPCLGGALTVRSPGTAGVAAQFIKAAACHTCPFDDQCAGAPEPLDGYSAAALEAALRPLPIWHSSRRPPRVLILSSYGSDWVFYASTLPALADALRRRGATVEMVSPWSSRWNAAALPQVPEDIRFAAHWDTLMSQIKRGTVPEHRQLAEHLSPESFFSGQDVANDPLCEADWPGASGVEAWLRTHDLRGFDLVIASDWATARLHLRPHHSSPRRVWWCSISTCSRVWRRRWLLGPGSRRAPPRAVGWPAKQLVLESGFPGYVNLYLNYGVPLEQVAWRPFPLYPGHFPPGPDVNECCVIMSGGEHLRDLETLRGATERLTAGVHPVLLYDRGTRFAGNGHLLHEGAVPLQSFYHALAHSRFVVVPLRKDTTRAAGVTVVAMALMAGRPVVATGITAIRDYVQHGAAGLLVPPGDPAALAAAITRLDRDPALLSALAAGARAAGRRLSTETWAAQIHSGSPPLAPVRTQFGWRTW